MTLGSPLPLAHNARRFVTPDLATGASMVLSALIFLRTFPFRQSSTTREQAGAPSSPESRPRASWRKKLCRMVKRRGLDCRKVHIRWLDFVTRAKAKSSCLSDIMNIETEQRALWEDKTRRACGAEREIRLSGPKQLGADDKAQFFQTAFIELSPRPGSQPIGVRRHEIVEASDAGKNWLDGSFRCYGIVAGGLLGFHNAQVLRRGETMEGSR